MENAREDLEQHASRMVKDKVSVDDRFDLDGTIIVCFARCDGEADTCCWFFRDVNDSFPQITLQLAGLTLILIRNF